MYSYTELSAPIRGTWNGLPIIILGVLGDTRFLVVDSEGKFVDLHLNEAMADFRFDFKKQEWVDVSPDEAD